MKAVYTFNDEHTGRIHIVIPKIREMQVALGSLVITFDNGDKRTFDVANAQQSLDHLTACIETFYTESR